MRMPYTSTSTSGQSNWKELILDDGVRFPSSNGFVSFPMVIVSVRMFDNGAQAVVLNQNPGTGVSGSKTQRVPKRQRRTEAKAMSTTARCKKIQILEGKRAKPLINAVGRHTPLTVAWLIAGYKTRSVRMLIAFHCVVPTSDFASNSVSGGGGGNREDTWRTLEID
ncbi:hypothetical protein LZ31DRAFT_253459 [Colletotrichum somersetense]|nr:hypothetical protein LZ31DRAFT_253459 [Colletotrichum somersetense]